MSVLTSVPRASDARVKALLSGLAWGGGWVSYSMPDAASDYGGGYVSDSDRDGRSAQHDGFSRLGATQVASVRGVLDCVVKASAGFSVEGFTNLNVSYAGVGSGGGDIRVANAADSPTAYAYLPGSGMGGDVFLGPSGRAPRAGDHDHLTILHEVGHALGLKHSHEDWGRGAVPVGADSLEFTVMSYRPFVGGAPTGHRHEAWGAPQSYMMLDIAALQEMYGADYSVNSGATVYRWTPGSGKTWVNGQVGIDPGGNRIFATVWDGGGRDTYDLSAYDAGVRVDLRPGQYSVFSRGQLADLGGGPNGGDARGNIFNALLHDGNARSLIENAVGGAGNDVLWGNGVRNSLTGNAGGDRLCGGGGADVLAGGKGADVFVFAGASQSRPGCFDRIVPSGGAPAFELPGRAGGDRIDLRPIDADTTRGGNQGFVLDGHRTAGHVWLTERSGVTHVWANTDRDATPEFDLAIHDGGLRPWHYSAHDFLF
jgi:serralysin